MESKNGENSTKTVKLFCRKASLFVSALGLFFACHSQTKTITYNSELNDISQHQKVLSDKYSHSDELEKQAVLSETRNYLTDVITQKLFPYWYGTPWDFNGTTREPGKGEIACGYFVTTVLEDAGFKVPRIKWAQSASEVFIVKLAPNQLKRFQDVPLSVLKTYLLSSGGGLYLAGLDSHVGFVWVEGKKIWFVHANYYQPAKGVMKEKMETKNPLSDSHYVIFGRLLSDEMCRKWLNGEAY